MKKETFYKIRRKSDGQFSDGGTRMRFSDRGKIWKTLGSLKNHINLVTDYAHLYYNCEIVEFEIVEQSSQPVAGLIAASREKQAEKAARMAEMIAEHKREEDLKKLAELKAKYEA